jgi:hypothetical protein
MEKFYLLVAGTRTFYDYDLLSKEIRRLTARYGDNICIVSGGARGADTLAERYAKDNGLEFVEFKAEWDKYGKSAGFIRNEKCISLYLDLRTEDMCFSGMVNLRGHNTISN